MPVPDPRLEAYARLLVERCLGVQPRWQVLVISTPFARPLVDEVVRAIARRGAYALPRIDHTDRGSRGGLVWAREAPEARVGTLPPIERHAFEQADAMLVVEAPENTREAADLSPARQIALEEATQPARDRMAAGEVAWVL